MVHFKKKENRDLFDCSLFIFCKAWRIEMRLNKSPLRSFWLLSLRILIDLAHRRQRRLSIWIELLFLPLSLLSLIILLHGSIGCWWYHTANVLHTHVHIYARMHWHDACTHADTHAHRRTHAPILLVFFYVQLRWTASRIMSLHVLSTTESDGARDYFFSGYSFRRCDQDRSAARESASERLARLREDDCFARYAPEGPTVCDLMHVRCFLQVHNIFFPAHVELAGSFDRCFLKIWISVDFKSALAIIQQNFRMLRSSTLKFWSSRTLEAFPC